MPFSGIPAALSSLRRHPWLFVLLLALQLLLLLAAGYLLLTYQFKLMADMESILMPLQQANLNAEQLQAGAPFLGDFTGVMQAYRQLMRNVLYLMLSLAGVVALGNGLLWALSHRLLERSWKQALQAWIGYAAASLLFFGAASLISYRWLRSAVQLESLEAFLPVMRNVALLFALAYILVLLAGAFADDWKAFFRRWGKAAASFHKVLAVLLLNAALLLLPLYVLYRSLSSESGVSAAAVALLSLLLVLLLALTRLLWIASLRNIADKSNNF